MTVAYFMNEHEVRRAAVVWGVDPTLGPAARTLENIMDATNRCSDGWAYWKVPSNACKQLMTLLAFASQCNPDEVERRELELRYRMALVPIRAMRTRQAKVGGIDFVIEEAKQA